MTRAQQIRRLCTHLAALADQTEYEGEENLSEAVLSVSCTTFRILYVPDGSEAEARMELNERLTQ